MLKSIAELMRMMFSRSWLPERLFSILILWLVRIISPDCGTFMGSGITLSAEARMPLRGVDDIMCGGFVTGQGPGLGQAVNVCS